LAPAGTPSAAAVGAATVGGVAVGGVGGGVAEAAGGSLAVPVDRVAEGVPARVAVGVAAGALVCVAVGVADGAVVCAVATTPAAQFPSQPATSNVRTIVDITFPPKVRRRESFILVSRRATPKPAGRWFLRDSAVSVDYIFTDELRSNPVCPIRTAPSVRPPSTAAPAVPSAG